MVKNPKWTLNAYSLEVLPLFVVGFSFLFLHFAGSNFLWRSSIRQCSYCNLFLLYLSFSLSHSPHSALFASRTLAKLPLPSISNWIHFIIILYLRVLENLILRFLASIVYDDDSLFDSWYCCCDLVGNFNFQIRNDIITFLCCELQSVNTPWIQYCIIYYLLFIVQGPFEFIFITWKMYLSLETISKTKSFEESKSNINLFVSFRHFACRYDTIRQFYDTIHRSYFLLDEYIFLQIYFDEFYHRITT